MKMLMNPVRSTFDPVKVSKCTCSAVKYIPLICIQHATRRMGRLWCCFAVGVERGIACGNDSYGGSTAKTGDFDQSI